MRSPESAIRLHLQPCVQFWQISGDCLSLMEILYSFFLPMSKSGLWTRVACSLSPYFFKKVIFRSIRQLARLSLSRWFACPNSLVDHAHSSSSLLQIMLAKGQFDSLQSSFIPTVGNDLNFSKIFLWVTLEQGWPFCTCQTILLIIQPLLHLVVWFAKWKVLSREPLKENCWA